MPHLGLQIVTYEVILYRPLTAGFSRSVKRIDEYSTCIAHFYAHKSVMTLSLGKAFPFEMALGTYPLGIWGSLGKALMHTI